MSKKYEGSTHSLKELRASIATLEAGLATGPASDYQWVIGKDLSAMTDTAADWLAAAYDQAAAVEGWRDDAEAGFKPDDEITVMYVEFNGFDINTDFWTACAWFFAHLGPDDDQEWLCDSFFHEDNDGIVFTGFEPLQKTYATVKLDDSAVWYNFTRLVTCRMQEVIHLAHVRCMERDHPVATCTVMSTMHDCDTFHFSSFPEVATLAKLKRKGLTVPADGAAKSVFAGKTVVFTGRLQLMSREDGENLVATLGGKSAESVSRKTDYLVAGAYAGSKLAKAKGLRVEVLTEEQFKPMVSE